MCEHTLSFGILVACLYSEGNWGLSPAAISLSGLAWCCVSTCVAWLGDQGERSRGRNEHFPGGCYPILLS